MLVVMENDNNQDRASVSMHFWGHSVDTMALSSILKNSWYHYESFEGVDSVKVKHYSMHQLTALWLSDVLR